MRAQRAQGRAFQPRFAPQEVELPGWGVCAVALLGARPLYVVMPILSGSLLFTALAAGFSRLRGDGEPYPHHWL